MSNSIFPELDSLEKADRDLIIIIRNTVFGQGGGRCTGLKNYLREKGADVNAVYYPSMSAKHFKYFPYGKSALRLCVRDRRNDMLTLMLSLPEIDVNAGNPLWTAIGAGNSFAVMALLEHPELDLNRISPRKGPEGLDVETTPLEFAEYMVMMIDPGQTVFQRREAAERTAIAEMIQDELDRRRRRRHRRPRDQRLSNN